MTNDIQKALDDSVYGPQNAATPNAATPLAKTTPGLPFDSAPASAKITALYVTIFDRAADKDGLTFWVKALGGNASYENIAESFTHHPAFDAKFDSADVEGLVGKMYLNAFGKEGDAEGIKNWTNAIENGSTTIGEFVATLVEAAINYENDPLNPLNDVLLDRQETLKNKVDAAIYFTNKVGSDSNMSPETDANSVDVLDDPAYIASMEVIKGITSDPETVKESNDWVNNFINPVDPEPVDPEPVDPDPVKDNFDAPPAQDKVAALVVAMFDRAPDSEEIEYWSDQLENGGVSFSEMAAKFTQNPVYLIDFNGMTDKAFIEEIYVNMLGQASDAETTAQWVSALNGGLSRSDFVANFVTAVMGASDELEGPQNELNLTRQETFNNKVDVALYYAEKTDDFMTKDATTHLANNKSEPAYAAASKSIEGVTSDPATVIDAKADIDFTGAPLNDAIELFSKASESVTSAAKSMNETVKDNPYDPDYSADKAGVEAAKKAAQATFDKAKELAEEDALSGIAEEPIKSAFSDYIGADKEIDEANLTTVQSNVQNAINSEKTLFDSSGTLLLETKTITLDDSGDQLVNLARLPTADLNADDLTIDFGVAGGSDAVILPTLRNLTQTVTIENMVLGKGSEADTLVATNLAEQFNQLSITDGVTNTTDPLTFTLTNAKGGKLVLKDLTSIEELIKLYKPKDAESIGIDNGEVANLIKALNGTADAPTITFTIDGQEKEMEVNKIIPNAINSILGDNLVSSVDASEYEQVDFTLSELQETLESIRADGTQGNFVKLQTDALDAFQAAGEEVSEAGNGNIATQIETINEALSAIKASQDELVDAQAKLDAANKAIDKLDDALDYKSVAEKWFDDHGYKSPVELIKNLTATDGDDIVIYEGKESDGFSITGFGEEGSDSIYFGEEKSYSLVEIGEGQSITDNLGNAAAFEIFWQQKGDNVELYVENTSFAGSDDNMNNLSHVTLIGVTADSLNAEGLENGFLGVELAM